ncbi:hypothetical protein C8J45_1192 [Sphingomonas sp. PP-CE-3G-477]|uniref:hypothetical protein n=1 Tax=Sphingomonas sp. PP-CE-3G-477 TaxID=2135660 RepID=UPI000D34A6BD|nr:hypothetical protein [Sphingomonas sp. PP-CE-3G-477]PTQ58578.1 hypothetical protein C8J45_1192 [Sphingomonas sp. PP-CE-3G-477]
MIGPDLVAALDALLDDHPSVNVSAKGHAAHANRYVALNGCPIATEPKRTNTANLWVRADSTRRQNLADIEHRLFDHGGFDVSKPNHNLFGEPAFNDCDLIRYQPRDLWQAIRVILEVAGAGQVA